MGARISTCQATNLDLAAAKLLDCSWILISKMVDCHVLVFMTVIDLDLNFKIRTRSPHFDIYNSSYGQISGQRSDLNKTTVSTSKQN